MESREVGRMMDKEKPGGTQQTWYRHSLARRVFQHVLLGTLALGLFNLVIGLILYSASLGGSYIREGVNLTSCAGVQMMRNEAGITQMLKQVVAIYEEENPVHGPEGSVERYRSRLKEVEKSDAWAECVHILGSLYFFNTVQDLCLTIYDSQEKLLIYVADFDEDGRKQHDTGDWAQMKDRDVALFFENESTDYPHYFSASLEEGWNCTTGTGFDFLQDKRYMTFVVTNITLKQLLRRMAFFSISFILCAAVITVILGIVLSKRIQTSIVQPINSIAKAARDYVEDKKDGSQDEPHFVLLDIRTGDEIENLARILSDMEQELSNYVTNLTRVTAEKERIETELSLATRIQADVLPNIFPAFPERKEFDIYASMSPAKEVGGDFYDFFLIDEDHLGLVMADVSGKGIPAALFMMASKSLIQNLAMSGKSPARVLEQANEDICRNNREDMFVTVWLGILDLRTGHLTACSAGHEYPVFRHPGEGYTLMKDPHCFVLGGMEGCRYREYEVQLEKGSFLFLYTDGVPEAANEQEELFGTERMMSTLNGCGSDDPKEILTYMDASVRSFVGLAPQFDDLTMLCLRYDGETT